MVDIDAAPIGPGLGSGQCHVPPDLQLIVDRQLAVIGRLSKSILHGLRSASLLGPLMNSSKSSSESSGRRNGDGPAVEVYQT